MSWLYENYPVVIRAVFTTFVLYVTLIALVRINGLRSFADMTSTDLVVTVLIGNVLGTGIMYDAQSIWKTLVIIVVLLLIQRVFSTLKLHLPQFKQIATNQPLILLKEGQLLSENLESALVSEDDLRYKLRKEGVTSLSQLAYVVFETTGEISILKHSDDGVDDYLLRDIRRDR